MNKAVISLVIHGAIILSLQIFLLRNAEFVVFERYAFTVFLYPLIILMLPLKSPRIMQLSLAFILGLLIDVFYNSPGLHASAFVFTAFVRGGVLKLLEPRGGYRIETSPSIRDYGFYWFASYSGILITVHILAYYTIDQFTFQYIDKIIVNSIVSAAVSYLLILVYQIVRI